ncbi:PAS domain S-box protein [Lusitaniella coriacea LEGE 07157]|uniref:Adenylate cyclase n=1 Tax=Lusitaniella coriacea LEGE 07157 TaxID=945747 RepID=A0A8J7DNJ4_9CYAN|nr:adenylate/guanylate cyclase domain-containing protein [Lusitaniella coriacea]MBE9114699.1 PAS domain S-box protein [Lusitaniella coriacea LEGE 07157]
MKPRNMMFLKALTRKTQSETENHPTVPLRLVVVIPFLVQIFAAVGLTGYLSWRNASKAVNDLANQLSEEVAERIEQHIESFTDISHLVLELNSAIARSGNLNVEDLEQVQRLFWKQTSLSPSITNLHFASVSGDFLQIERSTPPTLSRRDRDSAPNWNIYELDSQGNPIRLLRTEEFDPRSRPWYKDAIDSGETVWSSVYLFADPPVPGITPARPIYDTQGRLLGVMAIDLTLTQMSQFLQELQISESGRVFIMERTGKLVATSESEAIYRKTDNGVERLKASQSRDPMIRETARELRQRFDSFDRIRTSTPLRITIDGQPEFVQVTPLTNRRGLDWLMVAVIPESNFMGQIRTNTYATIALCLMALGGATILGFYTSRWITRPIWRLARASAAIARGTLDTPVPGSRINEFSILARSLHQMIGQLQQSQAQLEDKFAKVFRATPDPIAITTLEGGHFLEVNDSFLEKSGYTRAEVLDQTAAKLNLFATSQELAKIVQKLKEEQAIYNLETQLRTKSGAIRTVLLSAEIVELDGELSVLYIANDISERVKAQEALQEAEARYRSIFENAAEGIFQITQQGRYLSVNPALARMYGYESPEMLIERLPNIQQLYVNPTGWAEFILVMEKEGAVSNLEYQVRRRDGTQIWVSENARAVKDETGQLLYYEGTIEDITRRKEAEAALQEKEQYLRLVLDNIPQQVFWKDRDSRFLGCNKNWADAAGLESPEAVVGLTDFHLLPEAVAKKFRATDRYIMENNQPDLNKKQEKQKRDENGNPVWLDVSKIPIHDENNEVIGILGVIEDITLQVYIEEQRRKAEEALRLEQQKSEELLLNILPAAIARRLKEGSRAIAEQFDDVTILFADIVGFTPLSARLPATELVEFLNQIFSQFDQLAETQNLEKIKTIGDAYMVAGGLPVPREDHAAAIAQMALAMQDCIDNVAHDLHEPLQIRIGINTGPVVAGVIGATKFIYDLWGDTVNVASRMESYGIAGKIQVTEATYQRLQHRYAFEKRGIIDVKGKGEMTTYWLVGRKD